MVRLQGWIPELPEDIPTAARTLEENIIS